MVRKQVDRKGVRRVRLLSFGRMQRANESSRQEDCYDAIDAQRRNVGFGVVVLKNKVGAGVVRFG